MTKENGVKVLTDMVADFVAYIGKNYRITNKRIRKNSALRKQMHFRKFSTRQ